MIGDCNLKIRGACHTPLEMYFPALSNSMLISPKLLKFHLGNQKTTIAVVSSVHFGLDIRNVVRKRLRFLSATLQTGAMCSDPCHDWARSPSSVKHCGGHVSVSRFVQTSWLRSTVWNSVKETQRLEHSVWIHSACCNTSTDCFTVLTATQ